MLAFGAASVLGVACLTFFFGHTPVLGGDRIDSAASAAALARDNLGHGLPFSTYRQVKDPDGFAIERRWLGLADGRSVVDRDDDGWLVQRSPTFGAGTAARALFGVVLPAAAVFLAIPRRRVTGVGSDPRSPRADRGTESPPDGTPDDGTP